MNFLLWVGLVLSFLGLLFSRVVYAEMAWLSIVFGALMIASCAGLLRRHKKALKGRSAAFGLQSAVTVLLVIAIVCVINFLGYRYPKQLDLTSNQVHTLSDQSSKLARGLSQNVKIVVYASFTQRDKIAPLLQNYKALNSKIEIENVDPYREPTRTKQNGIKKEGTLQLIVGAKDSKVEDPTEEKITNALIKLLKDRSPTLCAVTGHNEKSFSSSEADGYDSAKKALNDQSYELKDVNLSQEGKLPEFCDALVVLGPNRGFLAPEVQLIQKYLEEGGRALFALDQNLKGEEPVRELLSILEGWHVRALPGLIIDPVSKLLGVDAAIPLIATYSKESPITRDFQANCFFPFTRPLDVITQAPPGLKAQWLSKTTPRSFNVTDMKELASGRVQFKEGQNQPGPLTTAIAVEGKKPESKATKTTRIVVFGNSGFANNQFSRLGSNLDFFLNSVSWILEDESLISIRSKEDGPSKIELSQKAGTSIFLVTVFVLPFLIAVGGIIIWAYRRRL